MPKGKDVPQFRDAARSHPRAIRWLNRVGRLLPGGSPLTADSVWESARKGALADREPTPEASEALSVLLDSLAANVRMTLVGRVSARDDTVRLARTHLRLHRALLETPGVTDTAIPEPIFIVGWPRTGTTFLHQLLAQDPANRTIPYWESFDPVPPPPGQPDDRIERLDRMLGLLARIEPRYDAIHPMTAESTEECVALFMNEFRTLQLDLQYRVPEYSRWLLAQDARIAYRLHRQQLQLIQRHRPAGERQVLKDPTHLVHLDALLEVYPGARIVFTHRDPAESLSSMCSLVAYTQALFTDDVDPAAVGAELLAGYWPTALEQARKVRRELPTAQAIDVRHPDLSRDPMATVEAIYAHFDWTLSGEARAAMRWFLDERRQARPGRHVHALGGFGLSRDAVRDRLAGYCAELDL